MASEWKYEKPFPDADPFAGYGPDRVVMAHDDGLDVEERDPLPWSVVAEVAAAFPSGLAAMAGALREAGYFVAEPGAESVSVLERDGEPSHMIGTELLSLPRGYAVVRYVRCPEVRRG
jgi:hypothetical protein